MVKISGNLSFKVKKTTELSDQEIDQLVDLIRSTMNVEKTRKTYTDKYLHNFLGYSFHALMVKEDKIVGCNTVIPQEFILFDKKYSFGQWCETLIDKNFRGAFSNFKKLGNILNEALLNNNIYFIYGLPNKALYVVSKRLLGMKDIGKLKYYAYPIKLNKFLKKYYPLNILLSFILKIFLRFKINHKNDYNFPIQKINNESFKRGRYFDDKDYKILAKDEYEVVYKKEISKKHNGAKIIWIIDVSPLDKLSLEKAVNELKKIDQDVDLIIYIGYLKTMPYNLIKIPDRFIKENNIFSGKILDEEKINEKVFDYKIWNINSSNFDYR